LRANKYLFAGQLGLFYCSAGKAVAENYYS